MGGGDRQRTAGRTTGRRGLGRLRPDRRDGDGVAPPSLAERVRRERRRAPPPGARLAGGIVGELLRRAGARPDVARIWGALIVGLVGALLLGVAGVSDNYLHRGVETSAQGPFVVQPVGDGLSVNEDLLGLPPDVRPEVIQQMAGYGVRFVRMPLSWSAVESEPGVFSWDVLDQTLAQLEGAGIEPVLTIVDTPDWAQGPATATALDTPPSDPTDMNGFVDVLMRQFEGRIPFLQIWDVPNDPAHWGGQSPDPVAYATLLGESANAARQADPGVEIVLAELRPTPTNGPSDLSFLRALYRASAEPFFDIVAIVADGGDRSPYDRQVDPDRTNVSRVILAREIMLEEEDAATPIWSTHFGWAAGPGGVSEDEQAAYTVAALDRMRSEWPWMGLAFLWDFSPDSSDPGRALTHDGQPTGTLTALGEQQSATGEIAPTGYAPLDAPAVSLTGDWSVVGSSPDYQSSPETGAALTVRFDGSGLIANVVFSPNAGLVRVQLDGGPVPGLAPDPDSDGTASLLDLGWTPAYNTALPIVTGLGPGSHTLTMELIEPGTLTVGPMVVTRDLPTLWPIVVLAVAGAVLMFFAVRELLFVLAQRRGYLRRRREIDINPAGRL